MRILVAAVVVAVLVGLALIIAQCGAPAPVENPEDPIEETSPAPVSPPPGQYDNTPPIQYDNAGTLPPTGGPFPLR